MRGPTLVICSRCKMAAKGETFGTLAKPICGNCAQDLYDDAMAEEGARRHDAMTPEELAAIPTTEDF